MPSVLVADDNPVVRRAIVAALEPEVEVYQAEDGGQAMEMMVTNTFDLLLLDAVMPGLDARETLKVMHARELKLPILVLAATSKLAAYADLQALGVEALVRKPLDLVALRAQVLTRLHVMPPPPPEVPPAVIVGPPPPAPVRKEFAVLLVDEHAPAVKRFVELTPAYVDLQYCSEMTAAMALIHKHLYRAVVVDVTALKTLRADEFTTLRMISNQAALVGLYLRTTADADAQALSQGLDLGLHKPFDPVRLTQLMEQLRGPYLAIEVQLNIIGLRPEACVAKNPQSYAARLVTELGIAFDDAAEACETSLWINLEQPAPLPVLTALADTAITRAKMFGLELGWVDPHGYGDNLHERLHAAGVTVVRSFDELGLG